MSENRPTGIKPLLNESLVDLFNTTSLIHRKRFGRESKKRVAQYNKVLKQLEDEESLIRHLTLFTKAMLEELDSGGLKSIKNDDKPSDEERVVQPYHAESVTDMRSRYIAQIMIESDEKSLESPQVRVLLSRQEGKPFYRSMVSRVMKNLTKFLTCKTDLHGGRLRVMRIEPFFNIGNSNRLERLCG